MRQIGFLVVSMAGMAWHAESICVPLCPLLCSVCSGQSVGIPILRLAATKRAASVIESPLGAGLAGGDKLTVRALVQSSSPDTGRSVRGAVGGVVEPLRLARWTVGVWGAQGVAVEVRVVLASEISL
jgi:hypothetical protein